MYRLLKLTMCVSSVLFNTLPQRPTDTCSIPLGLVPIWVFRLKVFGIYFAQPWIMVVTGCSPSTIKESSLMTYSVTYDQWFLLSSMVQTSLGWRQMSRVSGVKPSGWKSPIEMFHGDREIGRWGLLGWVLSIEWQVGPLETDLRYWDFSPSTSCSRGVTLSWLKVSALAYYMYVCDVNDCTWGALHVRALLMAGMTSAQAHETPSGFWSAHFWG